MRRLLVPALLVAALAAALFWWDLPRERREEESEQQALRLTRLDPALVDTLRVQREDGSFELVRRGADWWLTQPIEERADDASVRGVVNSLCRASAERVVRSDVDSTALDAFGLGGLRPPLRWIEMRSNGREPVVYDIGRQNPSGEAVYLRVRGHREVLLVAKGMAELARTSHQAFRIYDLFDVETDAIDGIGLRNPLGEFRARMDPRGLWYTEEDPPRRLQRRKLHQLAYDLAHARVRRYVEDGLPEAAFAAYGLHDPPLELHFTASGGSEQHTLLVGNESEEPDLPYARRDGQPTLLVVSGEFNSALQLRVDELVDTNPVVENFALLDSIRVIWHSGESLTVLPGYRGEWDIRPPPGWQGDPDHFLVSAANVVRGVEGLQSDRSVELSEPAQADQYLQTRRVGAELYWPDHTVRYEIGWRSGEDAHWLHIDGESRVHRIPRDLYFRLRSALLVAGLIDGGS